MNQLIPVINEVHPLLHLTQIQNIKEILSQKIVNYIFFSYNDDLPFDLSKNLTSKIVVPSSVISVKSLQSQKKEFFGELKGYNTEDLFSKRGYILVNGIKIDVTLIGLKQNIHNGTWLIYSNPNAATYEHMAQQYLRKMNTLSTNLLFYNYPGVGNSEGVPSTSTMIATHRAMLAFLEDEKEGIGANKIILWGLSIGGGVQAESIRGHDFDKNIKYVVVSEQTFHKLSKVPNRWFPKCNKIMNMIDWEFKTFSSSRELECTEVIIQKAECLDPQKPEQILDDNVISQENALAYAVLMEKLTNKIVIGVASDHCQNYSIEEDEHIDTCIINALQVHPKPL